MWPPPPYSVSIRRRLPVGSVVIYFFNPPFLIFEHVRLRFGMTDSQVLISFHPNLLVFQFPFKSTTFSFRALSSSFLRICLANIEHPTILPAYTFYLLS